MSVQLTVSPRQKDTQAKKKLNDDLFHQTANLYKVVYPGKYLFYPGKYLFVWYLQTNALHHFSFQIFGLMAAIISTPTRLSK
ncbi:hypothetical protein D4L85_13415 [Chryseolinea soli]|uniref:Uncharacterized protein n=1 Tax=Chryseolinea soli TaxID=2321403 RepID=A0A385SKU7_9BACT|nr:hypothetical protein D4L85_13415 [Chryseolinea soli]